MSHPQIDLCLDWLKCGCVQGRGEGWNDLFESGALRLDDDRAKKACPKGSIRVLVAVVAACCTEKVRVVSIIHESSTACVVYSIPLLNRTSRSNNCEL